MEGPDPKEWIAGGLTITALVSAITAFFKFGLPALRDDRTHESVEALKDLRAALEELHDAIDKLPAEVVNGVREAFADSVKRIDMQAREREIARLEAAAKRRA